jgi:lipopolysaccharide/colanic/teichoic acid biosynthesis glycosyltransferase
MFYKRFIKRFIDIVAASLVFILFLPILILAAVILYFSLNESPIFVQQRPGLNGKVFRLFKFKTMNSKRDSKGNLLPDEDRLTAIGKFFRSVSIDELPQLINVIKGDMSLIGPRPLLVKYLELYSPFQSRRHEVRPGITGWAQVNGRNALDWDTKFEFDVWYVDNVSFLLDVKIVFLTIRKVFKREGISGSESVTMKPFEGSRPGFKQVSSGS